jgi:hypothetical protein
MFAGLDLSLIGFGELTNSILSSKCVLLAKPR